MADVLRPLLQENARCRPGKESACGPLRSTHLIGPLGVGCWARPMVLSDDVGLLEVLSQSFGVGKLGRIDSHGPWLPSVFISRGSVGTFEGAWLTETAVIDFCSKSGPSDAMHVNLKKGLNRNGSNASVMKCVGPC